MLQCGIDFWNNALLTSTASSSRPACKWIFCSTRATATLLWSITGSLNTSFISALCTNIGFYVWWAGWTTLYITNSKIDTNISDTYFLFNSCVLKKIKDTHPTFRTPVIILSPCKLAFFLSPFWCRIDAVFRFPRAFWLCITFAYSRGACIGITISAWLCLTLKGKFYFY